MKKGAKKPYNKCLINFACSVCMGKYLPSVFFAQASLGLYENLGQILPRTDLALG